MIGNLYLQNFISAVGRWLYWFYIKLPPHILQQNCARASVRCVNWPVELRVFVGLLSIYTCSWVKR